MDASKFSVGESFERAGVALPGPAAAVLERYVALLLKWNAKINLTAVEDPVEIVEKHLVDSSFAAAGIAPGERVVDVGSGAGLPGLVIAVLCPAAHVTLVEANSKKVAFLRTASEAIANVEVVHGRDTDLPSGSWDRAISRATMEPPDWLRAGARLVRSGGTVGVMVADEAKLPPSTAEMSLDQVRRSVLAGGAPRAVGWYRKA